MLASVPRGVPSCRPSPAANSHLMPSPAPQGSPSFRLQTLQPRLPNPHPAPAWTVLGTNRLRLCSGMRLCPRGIWGSSARQQGPAGDPAHHPAVLRPGPGLLPTPGAPSRGRSCPPSPASEGALLQPSVLGCQGRAEALAPDAFSSGSSHAFSSGSSLSITVRQPWPLLRAPAA